MATNIQDAVRLPSSEMEFCGLVAPYGDAESLASAKKETFPPSLLKAIKYSGSALKAGRPLNKVMIVLTGESGVGKSSTIKALFNDETCFTDIESSETLEVTEYGRELCVTAEQPAVKGILSFVDMPGNFHSDALIQAKNLAIISKFREDHPDLLPRSPLPTIEKLCSLTVQEQVYPNTVLFTVKATDKRMVGPDSNLMKSLKALKNKNFVDPVNNNLIVVVTHAMSLPSKIYKAKSEEITRNIRSAVFEIFQITDAKVVFVENRPEDFDMEKPVGSDFYQLPDSQLSHYNLLQVMVDQFDATNDLLGGLLCGWFFTDDRCLEKRNNKTTIIYTVDINSIRDEEMKKSTKLLSTLTTTGSVNQAEMISPFQFQNLGRGYCPRTEVLRNVVIFNPSNIYKPEATARYDMYGQQYYFPSKVKVNFNEEEESYLLTHITKDRYERNRIESYGLSHEGIKLDVHIDSVGRWIKNSSGNNNSEVTFVYEKRLMQVALDDPITIAKTDVKNAIMQLPEYYEFDNCHLFNEFFSKWGSHFICKEWIGGCIEFETIVNGSTYNGKEESQINDHLQKHFKSHGTTQNNNSSTMVSMDDEMITTFGGDNSELTYLADVRSEKFSNWKQSIKSRPTELSHSFKLFPYYDLVEGLQHSSLKEATFDYLTYEKDQKVKTRRPMFKPKRNPSGYTIVDDVLSNQKYLNCFSSFAKVRTTQGSVPITLLKPGDEVCTAKLPGKLQHGDLATTHFLTYLHYEPEKSAEFMVIHLENGTNITLTEGHLIYVYNGSDFKPIRAKNVQIGDKLLYCDKENVMKPVSVARKSTVCIKGVFSPLTSAGSMIVDGLLVSCYANVDSHFIAHCSMAPLRLWYCACNMLRTFSKKSPEKDLPMLCTTTQPYNLIRNACIHKYAQLLMLFSAFLPFELLKC